MAISTLNLRTTSEARLSAVQNKRCKHISQYYDREKGTYGKFICDELINDLNLINKKLCLFHDKDYLRDKENGQIIENVKKRLIDKIKEDIKILELLCPPVKLLLRNNDAL